MTTVRDRLSDIENNAGWLKYYSDQLVWCVGRLAARRSFETNAQAEIDEAERTLSETLAKVQSAKQAYAAKPVNDRAA